MIRTKIPGLICGAVLCGILVAGLAPFGRPRNGVTWLEDRNGLHFANYATILSSGAFQAPAGPEEPACSIEIWLQPGSTTAASALVSFSTPENPLQLVVHQYHSTLIVKRQPPDDPHRTETIGVDGVFRQIKPVFASLTSGAQKTSMYVNGSLAESFPRSRFGRDCAGKLVVGTSPIRNERWSGQLLGLAIFRRELTPEQVLHHFETWTTGGRPELAENEGAVAEYLFDERAGNTVHNAIPSGIDLHIPEHYSLLHQAFLEAFWKEYKPVRSYWEDVAENIIGFLPLGFFFCAYWSSVRPIKHPVLTTVVLGFAVSLTIEVIQGFIPVRSSGTTDLFTNTLGTFLGVRLYATKTARDLLARFFFAR
ncbi:MAG: VanZ family protein [Candidatus Acidiferrales bacterium]